MVTKAEISIDLMIDLGDIGSADWLRFVQDEEFVLAELPRKVLLELDVEVRLHGVEEEDGVLARHLEHVIDDVLRLEIVELGA